MTKRDLRSLKQFVRDLPARLAFRAEYRHFRAMSEAAGGRFPLKWSDRHPCLGDRTSQTAFDRHYIYHTAWAARIIARTRPTEHLDIGSSLFFCSLVSAFVRVRFCDLRPPTLLLPGLEIASADLLSLPFPDGSVTSLSCMHVVEHIGLGRYGDPLDPDGDLKAIAELKRVLAPAGSLLFVVPVGRPRIVFNAHRVYSLEMILDHFRDLALVESALLPDDSAGGLVSNPGRELADAQKYGCGCFWFRRS